MSTSLCPSCGEVLEVGSWPFCKDGHAPAQIVVKDDSLLGGPRFFDTMGPTDVWIESHSQWKREVAKRNLVCVDRHDEAHYRKQRAELTERYADEARSR